MRVLLLECCLISSEHDRLRRTSRLTTDRRQTDHTRDLWCSAHDWLLHSFIQCAVMTFYLIPSQTPPLAAAATGALSVSVIDLRRSCSNGTRINQACTRALSLCPVRLVLFSTATSATSDPDCHTCVSTPSPIKANSFRSEF